jgi:hypothetical protein
MVIDYGLWNAAVSTLTLLIVATTAFVGLRQVRHLRGQNTLSGVLKVLDDWRDPDFQAWLAYMRHELPKRMAEPGFFEELDRNPIERARHPELHLCDWYEQVGSFLKHGLLDERTVMDVSWSSSQGVWKALEPVIERMRRTRGDTLYENFEYFAALGVLFERAHPHGTYPATMPRMRDLRPRPAPADDAGTAATSSVTG